MNILKNNLFKSPVYIFVWLVILTCLGISSWLGIQVPQVIKELFANYDDKTAYFESWWSLAYIYGGVYINRLVYQLTINKTIQHLLQNVRTDCYSLWVRSYQSFKTGKEREYTMGEILARIMSDTEAIKELLASGSFGIIIDLFFIISCFVGFMQLNTFVGISFVGIEVGICLFMLWGSQFMARVYMSVRKAIASMSRVMTNLVEGFSQTYHTPHHNYALKRGEYVFEDFLHKQLKANIWDASYYSFTESLLPILLLILALIVPYAEIANLAIVAALIDLLQRSISPIKEVAGKISNIQRALTGIERLEEFQEVLSARPHKERGISYDIYPLINYHLKVDSFRYGQDERSFEIKNFDLNAKSGQLIGIIGKSGSGKSTVLKIITGALEPQEFRLNYQGDGNSFDFSEFDKKRLPAYRQQISLISQDSHIFSDSIKFNICLGEKPDGVELFWEDCLKKLPYLKQWGIKLEDKIIPTELSLGQKQLISALRSCYLSRPIVLLDEISSALDATLELSLRILTKVIQSHSLLIVVAHRIETIIEADEILVMDRGQIVARGQHSELESKSEVYQDFVRHLGRV